ncbi:MAG: ras 2 [Benniella sp.]|nr:MAG: ras 2 [Benniella sp.]
MSQKLSIVIVGDGAVGKSALTLRFLRDQYDLTIEDSYCKHIEVDGQEYTLDINDTAGQNEYRGHGNDQFLRERDGFVCVYSITSTSSFEQLIGFRDRIWRAKESRYVPMIMVGNKRDLSDHGERQIPTEMGARLAEQSNSLFVEASAKTGSNVDELFMALVREIARTRRGKGISKRASASSMSAKAPSGSVNGDSRNVTLPATKRSERDRKPKKLKSYQCCTIM